MAAAFQQLGRVLVFTRAHRFSVTAGKWDQLAKLGEFDKEGEVEFNEETLQQGLKNFARRKNLLSMDYEHQALNAPANGQPAPGLAFYSAMALVLGGRVAGFDTKDPAVQPPDLSGLDDGLYIYRAEVTPLGELLLPNYKYLSPAFMVDGKDEQGNSIGLDFLNVAATNTPFLDGMRPIEMARVAHLFSRAAQALGATSMSKKTMERYGLGDIATPDEMMRAMERYADSVDGDKKDSDEKFKKLASELEEAKAARKMSDADDDDKDEDKKEMRALAADLSCAQGMKSIREAVKILRFSTVPKDDVANLKKELGDMRAEREREKVAARDAEIVGYAKLKVEKKALLGEDEASWVEFAKFNRAEAEKLIKADGWYGALQRYTQHGHPVGKGPGDATDLSPEEDSDVVGGELVVEAKKLIAADPKLDLPTAMSVVFKKRPELYRGRTTART